MLHGIFYKHGKRWHVDWDLLQIVAIAVGGLTCLAACLSIFIITVMGL